MTQAQAQAQVKAQMKAQMKAQAQALAEAQAPPQALPRWQLPPQVMVAAASAVELATPQADQAPPMRPPLAGCEILH